MLQVLKVRRVPQVLVLRVLQVLVLQVLEVRRGLRRTRIARRRRTVLQKSTSFQCSSGFIFYGAVLEFRLKAEITGTSKRYKLRSRSAAARSVSSFFAKQKRSASGGGCL